VIGTHAIQTLLALTGRRAISVFCRIGQYFYPEYAAVRYEDWAELLLRLEDGITAGISVGRLPHRPKRSLPLVEVSGTRGYAAVEGDTLTIWPGPETATYREAQEERYERLFGGYLRAVETGGASPIGFSELCEVQRVLEAAYASAESGKPVPVYPVPF
jgi:predicted dehydrogenase